MDLGSFAGSVSWLFAAVSLLSLYKIVARVKSVTIVFYERREGGD